MFIWFPEFDARRFPLDVEGNDTIDNVKARICDITGIVPARQRLSFAGHKMEYHRTVSDYNIHKMSMVALHVATMKVFVQTVMATDMTTLDVAESDTANMLKYQLFERLLIPPDQHRLIFRFVELEDGETLSSYGIHNGCCILMNPVLGYFVRRFLEKFSMYASQT